MRCALLLTFVTALAAADPSPAALLPGDAPLAVSAPDLGRSAQRWATAPYARLADTPWGLILQGEWHERLESAAPGASQVLSRLSAVAVALPQEGVVLAVQGDAALLRQTLTVLLPTVRPGDPPGWSGPLGRGELRGGTAVVALGGAALPGAAAAGPVLADGAADAIVRVAPAGWPVAVQGTLRLDPLGLRELVVLPGDAPRRALAAATTRWADVQELRALPATTMWAATWTADAAALAPLLAGLAAERRLDTAEQLLAGLGCPGLGETLAACDGPATVWMSEGVPFPSLSLAIAMSEPVARRWIAALGDRCGLAATPDGGRAGFVGLVALAVGWADGRLVLTTDPTGLESWRTRKPGFAELPAVRAALADLPARSLALGAGRGGDSWATLAQLVVPVFVAMGAPQSVSLPQDLRAVGGHGAWQLVLLPDGTLESRAVGLFGGPLSASLFTGLGVRATLWLQEQLRREHPAPAPRPATEPPVF